MSNRPNYSLQEFWRRSKLQYREASQIYDLCLGRDGAADEFLAGRVEPCFRGVREAEALVENLPKANREVGDHELTSALGFDWGQLVTEKEYVHRAAGLLGKLKKALFAAAPAIRAMIAAAGAPATSKASQPANRETGKHATAGGSQRNLPSPPVAPANTAQGKPELHGRDRYATDFERQMQRKNKSHR